MDGPILVTGGAGFIGSHVVDALLDAGHPVRVLDALLPAAHRERPDYLDPRAEWIEGDVRDPETAARAVAGVAAVSHQAAMVGLGVDIGDIADYVGHNDLGTAVLLRAIAADGGPQRLVLASSMVVYGEGRYACPEHGAVTPSPRSLGALDSGDFESHCPSCGLALGWELVEESAPLEPRSSYAASKVAQEHYASAWARQTGGSVVALRYHNVYGPGMPRDTPYSGVAAIFRSSLERGEAPRVFEDGGQVRDFVHVDDVARANLVALSSVTARPAESWATHNVCSGTPVPILRVAEVLCEAADGPAPQVTGDYRPGDVRHVVASPELASTELGFTASITPEQGIAEFATAPLRG